MRKNKVRKMRKIMKNKKILFIFTIILFLIMISFPLTGEALTDPTEKPDLWEPTLEDDSALNEKVENILGIINAIGIVVAIIVLMVLGVKYMLGSVEEKADYKKTIIPYLIGMFLLVSVTTLPNLIYQIVTSTGFFG